MSISISIPLTGQSVDLKTYYVNNSFGLIEEDTLTDYRLLGYISGRNSPTFIPEQYFLTTIDTSIPAYKNSLVSATLGFVFVSGIPDVIVFDETIDNNVFLLDPRNETASLFASSVNIPVSFSTHLDDNTNIISYYDALSRQKTEPTIYDLDTPSVFVSLFEVLNYHVSSDNWNRNDRVIFFISGIPFGGSAGGAIRLSGAVLNIEYDPVPPFSPQNIIVSETDYKQITVNWQAPEDDGGSNITDYIVEYGEQTGQFNIAENWTVAGTTTGNLFAVNNLDFDTNYIFRVSAKNSAGVGEYSIPSQKISVSKGMAPVLPLSFNDSTTARIRLRRDYSHNWSGVNPVLAIGEPGYELDSYKCKVGDGVTAWSGLPYVKVDNSSIDFPDPPDIFLRVASSKFNLPNNDRIILNLSSGQRLNILGEEGITLEYSNDNKSLIIKNDKLYDPINSGTIVNPTSSGSVGSLLYDNEWLYFCVKNNYWKRAPLDKDWLDFASMSIANNSGSYASSVSVVFDKDLIKIDSDSDPYPALAGRPLTNDGISLRGNFYDNNIIRDNLLTFIFRFRGGTNTHNPSLASHTGAVGIMNNGVVIFPVSIGSGAPPGFVSAPSGFTYNGSFNNFLFLADNCGGYADENGLYRYRDGYFLKNCWSTQKVYNSNNYYQNSHYSGDHFRHNDGHSKILGFCFDGYPIYGPFYYTNKINESGGISLASSSYSGLSNDSHRPTNWKYWNTITINNILYSLSHGIFNEDYVYSSGYGVLDEFNGMFSATPEFPQGTYAYYLSFTDETLLSPSYPYIFGTGTKESRYI
jgi:hypothetical protein